MYGQLAHTSCNSNQLRASSLLADAYDFGVRTVRKVEWDNHHLLVKGDHYVRAPLSESREESEDGDKDERG